MTAGDSLFAPLKLGPHTLANRILMGPLTGHVLNVDGGYAAARA